MGTRSTAINFFMFSRPFFEYNIFIGRAVEYVVKLSMFYDTHFSFVYIINKNSTFVNLFFYPIVKIIFTFFVCCNKFSKYHFSYCILPPPML